MSDGMEGAMDMAATGVGLGIMTMGAMIPIRMMQKMADETPTRKKRKRKGVSIKMPKLKI